MWGLETKSDFSKSARKPVRRSDFGFFSDFASARAFPEIACAPGFCY
jgi:hypothetical protein